MTNDPAPSTFGGRAPARRGNGRVRISACSVPQAGVWSFTRSVFPTGPIHFGMDATRLQERVSCVGEPCLATISCCRRASFPLISQVGIPARDSSFPARCQEPVAHRITGGAGASRSALDRHRHLGPGSLQRNAGTGGARRSVATFGALPFVEVTCEDTSPMVAVDNRGNTVYFGRIQTGLHGSSSAPAASS